METRKAMRIEYKINDPITTDQFIALLKSSTLGERRPVSIYSTLAGMIANSNLTVSAWASGQLIGLARSVTDYHYACYLSDLAVDQAYQNRGIGKRLQILTREQLGPQCSLILLAAPAANSYYEHIGYTHHPRCWVLERMAKIRG